MQEIFIEVGFDLAKDFARYLACVEKKALNSEKSS